jgi:hypothetical protein
MGSGEAMDRWENRYQVFKVIHLDPMAQVGLSLSLPGGVRLVMCDQNSTYGLHSLPGVSDWLRGWIVPAVSD